MSSTATEKQTAQKRSLKSNLFCWVPTVLVAGVWLSGSIASLSKSGASMEVFHRLGYPDYFATLLGSAQLLGVIALLRPYPGRFENGLTQALHSTPVRLPPHWWQSGSRF